MQAASTGQCIFDATNPNNCIGGVNINTVFMDICPGTLIKAAPTNAEDRFTASTAIAHELTHTSYGSTDATRDASDCKTFATSCMVPSSGTDLQAAGIARCMEIFFNQYFIDHP